MSGLKPLGPSETVLERVPAVTDDADSAFLETFGRGAPPTGILHVVGRLTEAVFHLLGPVCSALHAEGRQQSILLMADATGENLVKGLDPKIAVHYVKDFGNPIQRWIRLSRTLDVMITEGLWEAVYLHGLKPLVVGARLARQVHEHGGRLFVTPHNSRSLRSLHWLGRPALGLVNHWFPLHTVQTIANVPFDVRAMKRLASISARLLESPVDPIFFSACAQSELHPPVIVGGAGSDASGAVELFAQLAILLCESLPTSRFIWLAGATEDECALLQASGVEVDDRVTDSYHRAQVLASASLYIAPGAGRGFEMLLAEAMAVGLPCVGHDTDALRDMLTHGETGLLADTAGAMAQQVLMLLRGSEQRSLLSAQARREAILRFSDEEFRRHLLSMFKQSRT